MAKLIPDNSITIQELVRESHQTAKEKGWWSNPDDTLFSKVLLLHTEISELVEDLRHGHNVNVILYTDTGKPYGPAIELADLLIRIGDLCGYYEVDLDKALTVKLAYNKTRPERHGGKVI